MLDSLIVIGLATASLGTIQESDGVVERTFWLRNVGADTVALVQGYTSCGCTTIQFDRTAVVAPGDSTSVALRFNPRGKGGAFLETGTIVYGESRKRVAVALEGECVTSEETLLRQFPVRISDSLRLSTDHLDLGRMAVGETKERGVVALHRDGNGGYRQQRLTVTFTVAPDSPKGLQHIPYKIATIDGGARKELTILLDVFVR